METTMSVAFFDVDDTILKGSSGLMIARYLLFDMGEKTSLDFVLEMGKAYIDSKTGACDYDVLVKKGLKQFVGRTREEIAEISRGCFEKYMRKSIYRLAYREIVRHRENGRKVIFLTASVKQLIRPLADFLGADELFALNPIFDADGGMTADAEKPFSYENGKLILAREYIQENNIDLKDCFFYSDSSSDMPLMDKVGHPRPTNPDPTLRRIALMRNWRVHKFNSVLPANFKP